MAYAIKVRKIDNKSTIIAIDTPVFDAPIIKEKGFDYDDYDGVIDDGDLEGIIDDFNNPDDRTIPITVDILRDILIKYSKSNQIKSR